jgi:hypothetical protein
VKKLPCGTCGEAMAPGEGPVLVGRLSTSPLRYRCARCKRPQVLTAQQWNQIPDIPDEEALQHLESEQAQRGAPSMRLDSRVASSVLSPTSGRLVS